MESKLMPCACGAPAKTRKYKDIYRTGCPASEYQYFPCCEYGIGHTKEESERAWNKMQGERQ